jgi:hypothetical protein
MLDRADKPPDRTARRRASRPSAGSKMSVAPVSGGTREPRPAIGKREGVCRTMAQQHRRRARKIIQTCARPTRKYGRVANPSDADRRRQIARWEGTSEAEHHEQDTDNDSRVRYQDQRKFPTLHQRVAPHPHRRIVRERVAQCNQVKP